MKERKIELGIKEIPAQIFYHSYRKIPVKTLLIPFETPKKILSTQQGFRTVEAVGNNSNPPPIWEMVHKDWRQFIDRICADLGQESKQTALLTTGADVDNLGIAEERFKEFEVISLATAGVKSNALRAAGDSAENFERDGNFFTAGTINIILLVKASLSEGAMVQGVMTATEAKTAALQDLDIRSCYSPLEGLATGTGTDGMIIVSLGGPKIDYVGGHSKMGEMIARATAGSVKEAIRKQNNVFLSRSLEERLKERGIMLDDLIQAGMEMYIPYSQDKDREELRPLLKKELTRALKDINVSSLILAGLKLEEEGCRGAIPGLSKEEYEKDPVHLIADEMLGIQIATYIAGTRALFEFERFDRKKPGILGKLPPFLDDVIGGLISGALVKVCSE
jgi:alpha-ribazole phosphatase CobZ